MIHYASLLKGTSLVLHATLHRVFTKHYNFYGIIIKGFRLLLIRLLSIRW